MRNLAVPQFNGAAVYADCVALKKNSALKTRLEATSATVAAAAGRYEILGDPMRLNLFQLLPMPPGTASQRELSKLYDSTLARRRKSGRPIYDAILTSTPHGICPFCGHGYVSTLDHYLPKRPFGVLSVVPLNLVPACKDCNYAKGNKYPASVETQPAHPYFDNFDDAQWLRARIIRNPRVLIEFFVTHIATWSEARRRRIVHHFNLFELDRLFSTQAGVELVIMQKRLRDLHAAGGLVAVRDHLTEEAVTRRSAFLNSWPTALYEALAGDNAFCNGDFEQI